MDSAWTVSALLLSAFGQVAMASGVVTACASDVDPTPGKTNLASALAGGGSVSFACGSVQTIRITRAHQLSLPVDIDGSNRITLDAQDVTAMFELRAGSSAGGGRVAIRNIVLKNGASNFADPGGGTSFAGLILGVGRLELFGVKVLETRAPIAATSIEITNSHFFDNDGVLLRGANITIRKSVFEENNGAVTKFVARGIPRPSTGGVLTIEDSQFRLNGHVNWRGIAHVRRSDFTNNGRGTARSALMLSGEAHVSKSKFVNNSGNQGGAIDFYGGAIEVQRSQFRGNRASGAGGALAITREGAAAPTLRIGYTSFASNAAELGGAISIMNHEAQPTDLTGNVLVFVGNAATRGGAIYSPLGKVTLRRSLLVDNGATEAGAIYGSRNPEHVLQVGNTLIARTRGDALKAASIRVVNSTLADNRGSGISSFGGNPTPAQFQVSNSILLRNQPNCSSLPFGAVVGSSSLQFPEATCGASITTIDPALDDHFVPIVGSPARQAADNLTCVNDPLIQSRDLINSVRPEGPRCTIGAIEGDFERPAMVALRPSEGATASPQAELIKRFGLSK